MSYTNRVQAYNAKMRVFGSEATTEQNTAQNDSTINSTDEQFVSFAFYESVAEAKKDNYPGGLAFAHDASLNSGVIFKEGSIVSSKVLDVKVETEALPEELASSTASKAEKITVSYVDEAGNIAEATFSTVNQDFVKEFVNVVASTCEEAAQIASFLKETDNISAVCEQVEGLFTVKSNADAESGFVSYEISLDYAKLAEKIASENEARFAALEANDSSIASAIEQITEKIAGADASDEEIKTRLDAIEESYVSNVAVLTTVEESSLTDTVQVSISQKSGSSSDVQFEIPSEEFYDEHKALKDDVALLEMSAENMQTGIEGLKDADTSLLGRIDEVESELNQKIDDSVNEVKESVKSVEEKLDSSIVDIESDLNDLKVKDSELETKTNSIETSVSETQDKLTGLEEKIDSSYQEVVEKIDALDEKMSEEIQSVRESVLDVSANVDEFALNVS